VAAGTVSVEQFHFSRHANVNTRFIVLNSQKEEDDQETQECKNLFQNAKNFLSRGKTL